MMRFFQGSSVAYCADPRFTLRGWHRFHRRLRRRWRRHDREPRNGLSPSEHARTQRICCGVGATLGRVQRGSWPNPIESTLNLTVRHERQHLTILLSSLSSSGLQVQERSLRIGSRAEYEQSSGEDHIMSSISCSMSMRQRNAFEALPPKWETNGRALLTTAAASH